MSEQQASKLDEPAELVRMGGRAYRIRTQVVVEEVGDDDTTCTNDVRRSAGGSFEMMLSDDDATSIDKSEQAILKITWVAMRDAFSQHLTAVSKKSPKRGGARRWSGDRGSYLVSR